MKGEHKIIQLLKEGKHEALKPLMDKYQSYVMSIMMRMLTNVEAEEATQDTFIKVYKRIRQYNNTSKFSTWIYSIAYRTALDYLKKRRHTESINQPNTQYADSSTDLSNVQNMNYWITHELQKLSAEDAGLIQLYYLQEHSIEEVAKVTKLSIPNVKIKLFRIRKTLKESMGHLHLNDIIG